MREIKEVIEFIKNRKEILEELESLDRDLCLEKSENAKLKIKIEELKMAEEKKNDYLESIKKLRTENRKLKKENKFLIERENKLQTIEEMFVNKQVDLKELNEIILKTVQK